MCAVGVLVVTARRNVVVARRNFSRDVGIRQPPGDGFQPVGRVPVVVFDECDQSGLDLLQGDRQVAAKVFQWIGFGTENQVLLASIAVGRRLAAVSDDPLNGASIRLPGHPAFAELERFRAVGRAGDERQVGHSISLTQ